MENQEFKIEQQQAGIRIDKYLSDELEGISRSYIQKLMEEGNITVNQKCVKANYKLRSNDLIQILLPDPEELNIEPENIPLSILIDSMYNTRSQNTINTG